MTNLELTHEGGKPASEAETSYLFADIRFGAQVTGVGECEGWDFGAKMGKNPSGTVKISGSDAEVSLKTCIAGVEHSGEPTNGTIAIKSAQVKGSSMSRDRKGLPHRQPSKPPQNVTTK